MSFIESQSLFYWKLFCNTSIVDVLFTLNMVTILVLLEAVLQSMLVRSMYNGLSSHNPCFTGSCSAIPQRPLFKDGRRGHNPCFTGSCSAMISYAIFYPPMMKSQSLFYWKLFCNSIDEKYIETVGESQSLFYWKLFCNVKWIIDSPLLMEVTILVLLEAVLQSNYSKKHLSNQMGHNPCFTGSCSAIR